VKDERISPTISLSEKLFVHLTFNWPLAAGLIMAGALLAGLIGSTLPANYSASARLLIDHNVTEALDTSNREAEGTYLSRETVRLEALAYADALWIDVREEMMARGWDQLPEENTTLFEQIRSPHPMDGVWQFVAEDEDADFAEDLASAWAETFYDYVDAAIIDARRLQQLEVDLSSTQVVVLAAQEQLVLAREVQEQLEQVQGASLEEQRAGYAAALVSLGELGDRPAIAEAPPDEDLPEAILELQAWLEIRIQSRQDLLSLLEEEQNILAEEVEVLAVSSAGVSPYLEISRLQDSVVQDSRIGNSGLMALFGALLGLLCYLGWWAQDARKIHNEGDGRVS